MSIGVIIASYCLLLLDSKPKVIKLTFSLVDRTSNNLSLSILSTYVPTELSPISVPIGSISLYMLIPNIFPLFAITTTFESNISLNTSQMSLNTILLEL